MSEFEVLLSNRAEKGFRNAEPIFSERLRGALDELVTNPVPRQKFDVTKLSASESNYRIRIGRYRILYSVSWDKKQIWVFDIEKRKDRTYK